jgi:hypothetical protein
VERFVRPLVTVVLVVAQIALAGWWANGSSGAEPAFAALSPFTSMALIFWFKSRDEQKAAAATVAAVSAASAAGSTPGVASPLLRKVDETTTDTNERVRDIEGGQDALSTPMQR